MPRVKASRQKKIVTLGPPYNQDVSDDGAINVDISDPDIAAKIATGDLIVIDATPAPSAAGPGAGLFKFRGPWAPQTKYAPYDVVTFNGRTYLAQSNFTSGATFVVSNWFLLADKGNSVIQQGKRTGVVSVPNAVANTSYDVTGCSVTFTADGTSEIMLEGFIPGVAVSSGTPDVSVWIVEGANLLQAVTKTQTVANKPNDFQPRVPVTPTVGSHTYKMIMRSSTGGAVTLYANADPTYPAFLRAVG